MLLRHEVTSWQWTQSGASAPSSCLLWGGEQGGCSQPGQSSSAGGPLCSSPSTTGCPQPTDPSRLPFQRSSPRHPPRHLRPQGDPSQLSTRSRSGRKRSLGVTKQPPNEANDPFTELVYQRFSFPGSPSCCFWRFGLSEAEVPSVTSSPQQHGLVPQGLPRGQAHRAQSTPLGTPEGTVQKRLLLVSGQLVADCQPSSFGCRAWGGGWHYRPK